MSRRANGEGSKKRLEPCLDRGHLPPGGKGAIDRTHGRHPATAHDFDREKDGHAAGARAGPSTSRPARYQLQSPCIGERRPVIQQP